MKRSNYSGLFNLFAHDKPDKTSIVLQTVGKTAFTLSFTGSILGALFNYKSVDSLKTNIAFGLFGLGFFVGIFMFIAVGIHYSGRERGEVSFLISTLHLLKNTFLYLLLPVFIITALIAVWAFLTKQPAFR